MVARIRGNINLRILQDLYRAQPLSAAVHRAQHTAKFNTHQLLLLPLRPLRLKPLVVARHAVVNSQGTLPAHSIIELHPLCKPQPLVNLHGPGVVVPYMQERRLTSVIDALHQRSDQSSCVSAAEVVRMRGHRGDLTVSRDMQPQTTHGYQLAFNTHAHKRAWLLDAWRNGATRPGESINPAHPGNVILAQLDDPRLGCKLNLRHTLALMHHLEHPDGA